MNETLEKNGINETNADNEQTTATTVTTSPFCRADCKVCNSDHMEQIHNFIKIGKTYRDICDYLQEKNQFTISPASITRHMQNYRESLRIRAQQRELAKFDEEADELARHQKQSTILADAMFERLQQRLNDGSLIITVGDWEKVVKLRHGVLNGDSGAMDDLMGIFQQATDKYGVNLNQGVLFKKKIAKE